jgi:hypothetical protein
MAKTFNLGRTKQCEGCPWKASVDPNSIPNGLDRNSHARLLSSTALPGEYVAPGTPLIIMQCHDSTDRKPQHCAGWLHNQLGENNIPLRIALSGCQNINRLQVDGIQRESFQDLLPAE